MTNPKERLRGRLDKKGLLKAEMLPLSSLVNICQPFAALVSLSLSVLVKSYQPLVILFSTGPDSL